MNPLAQDIGITGKAIPIGQEERINILDSIRGIALLGILIMNIPFFGLPDPAGESPIPLNEIGTINEKIWIIVNGFLDGTQRALFSLLFGAGMLLFIERLERRTTGMEPAEYFIRRQLWLIVFGLFNAYVLLWVGDILFSYGVCGIILFAFRKLSVKALILSAIISLVLMTVYDNVTLSRTKAVISKGERIALMDSSKLTEEQKEALQDMKALKLKHSTEHLKAEMKTVLKKMKGSYWDAYGYFKDLAVTIELSNTYYGIWDVLIFMFLGMAFFRSGILIGEVPNKIYWILAVVGILLGGITSWWYIKPMIHFQYDKFQVIKNTSFHFYEIARTLRSLGIFGLLMLIYKSGLFNWLFSMLRPVGQMAFTNYLMQSFMCNLFFLGAGFDMMGKFDRKEVYLIGAVVWIIQIIWSHLWLRYFRFGPLEWCWRCLTYWKMQSIKK